VHTIRKQLVVAVCLAGFAGSALAIAPDFFEKLDSEARPLDDRMRDDVRRPYQVMQLLGVQEGMTVVDIGAGGGWWTWVFSAAVGPDGTVIAQGMRGGSDALMALGNIETAASMDDITANSVDAAVTALNIHHMTAERAGPYFQGIARALKPGGMVAVIDHVGVAGMTDGQQHRVQPALARAWIEAAGLEIVEESDILHTTADDHTLDIRDPILGRNVDRFLFIARKPR